MANSLYTGGSPYTFETEGTGGIPVYGVPLPNHAGVAQRPDLGYDTQAPKLSKSRRGQALKSTNGKLHDGTWFVDFFITKISIDIGLAGSTAQSRFTRDFYPHNMVMPSFEVEGRCLDQNDYGTLIEFIHQAQQRGVYDGTLLQLDVIDRGLPIRRPIMRGRHKPIQAQGFINKAPRQHKRWEYAPKFEFSFVTSTLFNGIYKESTAPNLQEESWAQVLQQITQPSPINHPPEPVKEGLKAVNNLGKEIDEFLSGF